MPFLVPTADCRASSRGPISSEPAAWPKTGDRNPKKNSRDERLPKDEGGGPNSAKRWSGTNLPVMDWRLFGILPVADINYVLLSKTDLVMIIGSCGASAVLIDGAIRSPLAQPRNLIGGHMIPAPVGGRLGLKISPPPALPGILELIQNHRKPQNPDPILVAQILGIRFQFAPAGIVWPSCRCCLQANDPPVVARMSRFSQKP